MESQVPAGVIYTKSQTPWSHSRWRVKLQDAIDTRESSSLVLFTLESQASWCRLHWRFELFGDLHWIVKLLGVIYTGESSSCVSFTLESQAPGCAIDTGESGSVHAFDDKEHGFLIQLSLRKKSTYRKYFQYVQSKTQVGKFCEKGAQNLSPLFLYTAMQITKYLENLINNKKLPIKYL